eukprot:5517314-Amphidinium_carterae.1
MMARQYLLAGARANVGMKKDRYMFECAVRQLVRLGVSTSDSSLLLDDEELADVSVWMCMHLEDESRVCRLRGSGAPRFCWVQAESIPSSCGSFLSWCCPSPAVVRLGSNDISRMHQKRALT